eukprot:PhF_6_TR40393/c0_g2_i2/m.60176
MFAAAAVGAQSARRKKSRQSSSKHLGVSRYSKGNEPKPSSYAKPPPPPKQPNPHDLALWTLTSPDLTVPEEEIMKDYVLSLSSSKAIIEFTSKLTEKMATSTEWVITMKCLLVLHRCFRDATSAHYGLLLQDPFLCSPSTLQEQDEFNKLVQGYCRYLDVRCGVERAMRWRLTHPERNSNTYQYKPSDPIAAVNALLTLLQELLKVPLEEDDVDNPVTALAMLFLVEDSKLIAATVSEVCVKQLLDAQETSWIGKYNDVIRGVNRMYDVLRSLELFGSLPTYTLIGDQTAPSSNPAVVVVEINQNGDDVEMKEQAKNNNTQNRFDDVEVCKLEDILGLAS